jgi:pimeloyl-ACP methyl ester carboxylesterase
VASIVNESPALFGPDGNLIGILTRPTDGKAEPVALLLFNAGVIHRVGPHRLNVKLAAHLAGRGFTTFRFDLAGQGDSRAAATRLSFSEQAVRDLKAAMDHVERTTGIGRFAIFGICSGAVNAFHAALADERVVGIAMFDGFWYTSRWTKAMRRWKRFLAMPWSHVFGRLLGLARYFNRPAKQAEDVGVFSDEGMGNPPRDVFARQVTQLVDRGVLVYFMYGGSIIEQVSYENQLRHAFSGERFVNEVEIHMFPKLDHTVVSIDVQDKMHGIIAGWLQRVAARKATGAPV